MERRCVKLRAKNNEHLVQMDDSKTNEMSVLEVQNQTLTNLLTVIYTKQSHYATLSTSSRQ
jgi:hypothetical protein